MSSIVKGIRHACSRVGSHIDKGKSLITLRPSQRSSYERLKDAEFGILNAPTGWGKSAVLSALAANDLLRDSSRKVVFCVPQRIVAKGFVNEVQIEVPELGQLDWTVGFNLCGNAAKKVRQIHEFLLGRVGKTTAERMMVTTHHGLAIALSRLSSEQFSTAIADTTFVIDEAHHVQAAQESGNQLGEAVAGMLDSEVPSVRVLLTTAYFFRGDKLPILQDRHLDLFHRHLVPFDEHWRSLTHLSKYRYDFVAYKGTIWKSLVSLLSNKQEPTIIYCPQEGHRLLLGSTKEEFTNRIIQIVQKEYGAEVWSPKRKSTGLVILNLVDTEHRFEKVKFAMEHGDRIAVILTVGMFREGADWRQAQRVIDLIPSGSDQDRNQRFGRLIRDYPGKDCVSYFSFFPQITKRDKGKQREELTKLYAHFHASLVLENALAPIKVMSKLKTKKRTGTGRVQPENLLGRFDEQTQEAIITDCHEVLLQLHSQAESFGTTVSFERARTAMIEVMKRHGVKDNEEPLAKQVVLLLRRRVNLHLPVAELIKAGFDKVWSSESLEGIRLYSAGFGGPESFNEIRRAIQDVFNAQWMELYEQIKSLPDLPSPQSRAYWWIQNNKSFYREGRLSDDRIRLLEEISWWKWQRSVPSRWNIRYEQIRLFDKCPPSGTKEYDWIRHQRRMKEQGRLSEERTMMLKSISWWTWNTYEKQFEDRVARLQQLAHSPKSRTPEYEFVKYFRRRKKEGKLDLERVKELEAISWWMW